MSPVAVFDGQVVDLSALRLSDFFSGYFFGAGLFETIRIVERQPQFLARHLERLKRGLGAVPSVSAPAEARLQLGTVAADISVGLERSLEVSGTIPGVVKLTVSDGHVLVTFRESTPTRAVSVDVLEGTYRAGDALLNHKTISYLKQYRHLAEGSVLFQNERGELCESPTANLFVVFEDRISTPPLSAPCLAGIVREVLLERGAVADLPFVEEPIPAGSMDRSAGAFLTNSLALAAPIRSYLGRDLPRSASVAEIVREALEGTRR